MGMHEKDMEKTPGLEMAYYKVSQPWTIAPGYVH